MVLKETDGNIEKTTTAGLWGQSASQSLPQPKWYNSRSRLINNERRNRELGTVEWILFYISGSDECKKIILGHQCPYTFVFFVFSCFFLLFFNFKDP